MKVQAGWILAIRLTAWWFGSSQLTLGASKTCLIIKCKTTPTGRKRKAGQCLEWGRGGQVPSLWNKWPRNLRGFGERRRVKLRSHSFKQFLRTIIWTVAVNPVIIHISSTLTVGETNAVSVVCIKIHSTCCEREPYHQGDAMEAGLAKGEKVKDKPA